MPINTTALGPGTLTLGAGALETSAQLTACRVNPTENVTTREGTVVMSGERIEDESSETYSYTLEGTFLQDLTAAEVASVVAWAWANKGTEQPFAFTPNTAAGVAVNGVVKPVPLGVGGDEVEARMSSDFTWRCVGEPTLDWPV